MNKILILILVLLLVAGGRFSAIGPCDDLPSTVTRIGLEPDPAKTIEQLHSCGQKAVPLLIFELRVMDPEVLNEEWMSRGEIFMAPQDVQASVIMAWKTWLEKNGASFIVQPYEPYGDWYF